MLHPVGGKPPAEIHFRDVVQCFRQAGTVRTYDTGQLAEREPGIEVRLPFPHDLLDAGV